MEGRGAGGKVGRAALVLLFAALATGAAPWTEGPGPFRVRTFVDEIDAGGWLHDMAYGAGVFVVVGPFRSASWSPRTGCTGRRSTLPPG